MSSFHHCMPDLKSHSTPLKASLYDVSSMAELLHPEVLFNILPTENDNALIYYVSDDGCRSLVRTNVRFANKPQF